MIKTFQLAREFDLVCHLQSVDDDESDVFNPKELAIIFSD